MKTYILSSESGGIGSEPETKMNILKVKTVIKCEICGCLMKKSKSIKVAATEKEAAKSEANEKVQKWRASLSKKCKICQSVIDSERRDAEKVAEVMEAIFIGADQSDME